MSETVPNYDTARFALTFLTILGWAMLGSGVVLATADLQFGLLIFPGQPDVALDGASVLRRGLDAAPGIGLVLFGLVTIAGGHVAIAVLDTAVATQRTAIWLREYSDGTAASRRQTVAVDRVRDQDAGAEPG